MNTFSHSSRFFDGVRKMRGKLDLQYSRFNMSTQLEGNCLFDIFNQISMLDLSSVKFYSTSNDIEKHIKHLLQCKTQPDQTRNGELLLHLNLRYLNLQRLPDCITNDRFPGLKQLDLSNNNIRSIDFSTFLKLSFIALAYNPIELRNISWNGNDRKYESVNLRSTLQIQTPNLMPHIKELFKITTNFDYSENCRNTSNNLTNFSMENDFSSVSLNLSQTNLYSFDIKDISRFDDLQRLDISSNYLTELNLEKQSKLTYLDCSNQKLKTLIINRDFLKLIQLKCSNNSLKTIENFSLSSHKNLQFIDLSFNQIESIENLFSNLNSRYLHTINLQSNSITQLSSKVFHSKLISLYSINLSWNKINLIKTNTFQSPNLQLLDLTGNPLKTIEAKFLFAPSLRLFYIVDNTRQLIDRCAQSTIKDNLLLTYISWFEQNGTYMKNTQKEKSEQIQMDKCLSRYTSRSKVKWMKINDQHHLKHLSLYITMAAVIVGIILGMIYLYKKKKFNFLTSLQRYRPLDRNSLMGNTDDVNHHQREDDEIVMNLDEPPFNTIHRS
jgi:Leucine-rich repeat (LRR) protein